MLKTLVIFVHPNSRRSRINGALAKAISDVPSIRVHDLYEAYPDFYINADQEQKLLLAHELVVFQHPLYWYGAPPLLKEWQVEVLARGKAYGEGGIILRGKYCMQAVSVAGTLASYGPEGQHRYSMDEILRPFEATARTCQMEWLPPFVTYGTPSMDGAAIAAQAERYRNHLVNLDPKSGNRL